MKSPGYDYFEQVFLPAVNRFGASVEAKMLKPGYYPKGGGIVEVDVKPAKLRGCTSWPQDDEIRVLIRLSGLPTAIAIREKKIFVQNDIGKVFVRQNEALSVGNAVSAWKGFRGAYILGEKGKRAEIVAQECFDALKSEKNDVDLHLADQLLVYAALAEGATRYTTSRISEHLRTNAYIISKFLDRRIGIGEDGTIEVS